MSSRAELRLISGRAAGQVAVVTPGEPVVVGRSSACDLQVHGEGVSRKHCIVAYREGQFMVADLGSRNGVMVNGERIEGDMALSSGDELEVGRHRVAFLVTGAAPRVEKDETVDLEPASAARQPVEPAKVVPPPPGGFLAEAHPQAPAPERGPVVCGSGADAGPGRQVEDEPEGPPAGARPAERADEGGEAEAAEAAGPAREEAEPVAGRAVAADDGVGRPTTYQPSPFADLDDIDETRDLEIDPLRRAIKARRIGDFYLGKRLGAGGSGVVFMARQGGPDGDRVALKVLRTSKATKPYHVERFRQECTVLETLQHPGIARCIAHGRADEMLYLAMEYCDGDNLDAIRKRAPNGRVGLERVLVWGAQVLEAIGHAHARNVIHRDLKPANMILTGGRVKLVDFGLARVEDRGDEGRLTMGEMAMGTRHFMPPEQLRDAAGVDHRADIYAVGVSIYLLVSGDLPYPKTEGMLAQIQAILGQEPRPLRDVLKGAPVSLERVLARALAKEPVDRFQSAEEMRAALDLVATSVR